MGIVEDLEKLSEQGDKAYELIQKGKLNSAAKILARINKSMYVSDAIRIAAPLEALIYIQRGKKKKAKSLICFEIASLWGSPFALQIMRSFNDLPNPDTRYFLLRLKGGLATLGAFTQFGDEYITTVEVLADNEFEAISFLDELLPFETPETRVLLECSELDFPQEEDIDNKGIYRTYPFKPAQEESSSLASEMDLENDFDRDNLAL